MSAGVVHGAGQGQRQGDKVLDLLGMHVAPDQIEGHLESIFQCRTRVGADEVIDQVSPCGKPLSNPIELLHKGIVHGDVRLSHGVEHRVANVLRGHLHASADVVAAQLFQNGVAARTAEQVVAKSAADEGVFDPRNLADAPVQGQATRVAGIERGTGLRGQAAFVAAKPLLGPARAVGPV